MRVSIPTRHKPADTKVTARDVCTCRRRKNLHPYDFHKQNLVAYHTVTKDCLIQCNLHAAHPPAIPLRIGGLQTMQIKEITMNLKQRLQPLDVGEGEEAENEGDHCGCEDSQSPVVSLGRLTGLPS